MVRALGKFSKGIKWTAVREITAVVIILCLSVAISMPAYIKDKKVVEDVVKNDLKLSSPEENAMDSGLLVEADQYLEKTEAQSFIVVRNGKIVYEKYYKGNNETSSANIYSVTKSFMSALIGIAIREGYIGGTDEKLEKFFPEYFNEKTDPLKRQITVKHLLTMTPGFCENSDEWPVSSNMMEFPINKLPLKYKPGEKFQYANSAIHLLSGILTKASGMSTEEFAQKYLFDIIGITPREWIKDSEGIYHGYSNLYLRPREMAKFGYLYLKNGLWNGKQVVPAEWVRDSMQKHVDVSESGIYKELNGYGYCWWTTTALDHYMYFASGYGGQRICIMPDLGVVVVVTSLPDQPGSINDMDINKIFNTYIIPAVKN